MLSSGGSQRGLPGPVQALTALAHLGMRTAVTLATLVDVARQLHASADAPEPPPSLLPRARALAVRLDRLAQHEGVLARVVPGRAFLQGIGSQCVLSGIAHARFF